MTNMKINKSESTESLSEIGTGYETMFKLDNLDDMIRLTEEYPKKHKMNQDVKKLYEIRKELKERNEMVGLENLKKH